MRLDDVDHLRMFRDEIGKPARRNDACIFTDRMAHPRDERFGLADETVHDTRLQGRDRIAPDRTVGRFEGNLR